MSLTAPVSAKQWVSQASAPGVSSDSEVFIHTRSEQLFSISAIVGHLSTCGCLGMVTFTALNL
jgi:hypothetical protein